MITQKELKEHLFYSPETGEFKRISSNGTAHVGDVAGWIEPHGYRKISVLGRKYYAHRLAFLYMNGEFPSEVDHINGIPDDNKWSNLRDASHVVNMQNRRKKSNTSSKYRGVWKTNRGFLSEIKVGEKRIYLGCFKDEESAAIAYKTAKDTYHVKGGDQCLR